MFPSVTWIPNAITSVRLVLLPWIVPAILAGEHERALVLCLIAGATDALDGASARLFHLKTSAGAYFDPIADKILLSAVYISLGLVRSVPTWLVVMIFARDVVILGGVAALWVRRSARRFPPSLLGKISTILQILTVLVALALPVLYGAGQGSTFLWVVIELTAVMTAASGLHYAVRGWRMWFGKRPIDGDEARV